MAQDRQNFYLSKPVRDSKSIIRGLQNGIAEAVRLKAGHLWLVTPAKSNLDGHIEGALGPGVTAALKKGNAVALPNSVQLILKTSLTLPFGGEGSPVVLCYPDQKLLAKVAGMSNIPSLTVLPWDVNELKSWADACGPIDLITGVAAKKASIQNPVVEQALSSFLACINKATGITHPGDRNRAILTFRILRDGGEAYSVDEARAWLVQHGLRPDQAEKIAVIAEDPSKARLTNDGEGGQYRENVLDEWRKEARGDGGE